MIVSIFGLGYVGLVSAVCLARRGHHVIGIDVNPDKLQSIRMGISPIVEPGVEELLRQGLDRGLLTVTSDAKAAVCASDVSLVCVGTPSNANGSLCLDQVMRVAEEIGFALRAKPTYHSIAVRSTVLPGTVDRLVTIIEHASGKTSVRDFGVASNPEFLREGTSIADFDDPPFTVVGAHDERLVSKLRRLYSDTTAPFYALRIKEAELLKYACNAFHATKVTFANEIGAISKQLGIDSHDVMAIFAQDTKLNISSRYLRPGFAFGGSCLPKDLRAINYESRALDVSTPLLDSLETSNQIQIRRVIDWVISRRKRRIGMLGLSFKSNTDDLRESPMVAVAETLLGKGFDVTIFDANVNVSRLLGANRSYIEQEIPHLSRLMREDPRQVVEAAEVILVGNEDPRFAGLLENLKPEQSVLDLVRISKISTQSGAAYEGIGW
jgi:GDP-mannose 6-dehydrogenase